MPPLSLIEDVMQPGRPACRCLATAAAAATTSKRMNRGLFFLPDDWLQGRGRRDKSDHITEHHHLTCVSVDSLTFRDGSIRDHTGRSHQPELQHVASAGRIFPTRCEIKFPQIHIVPQRVKHPSRCIIPGRRAVGLRWRRLSRPLSDMRENLRNAGKVVTEELGISHFFKTTFVFADGGELKDLAARAPQRHMEDLRLSKLTQSGLWRTLEYSLSRRWAS
ncbi:hypothetical protein E1301_Tti015458 [Triplophysa tibetana]|uniref:Uncharacterized protein n=1 Tax=Triplophysa tibetana TaxID=1572043 RepID=A0A5A9PPN7_9TELE|nr:hypothetical protein E1301_Tti015458 [Triplophysa tibetana]